MEMAAAKASWSEDPSLSVTPSLDPPPSHDPSSFSAAKRQSLPRLSTTKKPPATAAAISTSRKASLAARTFDSFRNRRRSRSHSTTSRAADDPLHLSFGFARLHHATGDDDNAPGASWSEPVGESMRAGKAKQLVGAAADEFLDGLADRAKHAIKTFVDTTKRDETECFMWILLTPTSQMSVLSVKSVENHFSGTVRRVKWRTLSTGRLSIYRYSIAVIPISFAERCAKCVHSHRKLCLICVWLCFVCLICITVVFASLRAEAHSSAASHAAGRAEPPPSTSLSALTTSLSPQPLQSAHPALLPSRLFQPTLPVERRS